MHVAVIGCGIVGAACAHALASRGVDVTVFEADTVGGGSTARSAGGIRTQFSTRVNVELSLVSLPTWESFGSEFGVDIAFRQVGYLFLAREQGTAETFEENVTMQRELGVPVELLSPTEAREHCPALRSERFHAATFAGCDGFADPYLALQGYVDGARAAGAEIRPKTPVTDLLFDGDSVSGVVAGDADDPSVSERVPADTVVNAAGPWARRVAALGGVDLPVAPKRRRMLTVDPETAVPEDCPLTIDLDTGSYFRPERDGAAVLGGEFGGPDPDVDPGDCDRRPGMEWTLEAVERAGDVAGYFGPETRIKRGWAGCYAVTPDHHPVIERSRPGFVNAVGFSGHGFQHAPATGAAVAEIVLDGESRTVDVSPLSSDRFETEDLLVERNVA